MLQVLAKDCYPEVITEKQLSIYAVSRVFAGCWILLKCLKMAEESMRTLQTNHAQFPNTSSS